MKQKSLRKLRVSRNLSVYALAKLAGISPMTIASAEQESRWPKNQSVRKALEQALGIA